MTETTENHETAKKRLAEDREARQKTQSEQREKMAKAKPTPTQAEIDAAAAGLYSSEHEDDGSGPEPHATRQMEPKRPAAAGGGYATREARPRASGSHSSE